MDRRQIKIVSWNVNGIRAAQRKGFLAWLAASGADIVALQETKASPEQLSEELRQPPAYHADWCSAEQKGYSGVVTFSRIAPLSVARGLCDTRFDADGRVLMTSFPDFVFLNIYFPNGGRGPEWVDYKLDFYARFLEVVNELQASGNAVVVAGDINTAFAPIDLARPRENATTSGFLPREREALGKFFDAGLVDTFRHVHPSTAKYSWWAPWAGARARNIGWRIDYILVSESLRERIVDADIHPDVMGSDHCPVSLTLALS